MASSQNRSSKIITGPISGFIFGAVLGTIVALVFYLAWQAVPKGHNSFGVTSFLLIGIMGILSLPWGILFWAFSSASFEAAACISIAINFSVVCFLIGLYRRRARKM